MDFSSPKDLADFADALGEMNGQSDGVFTIPPHWRYPDWSPRQFIANGHSVDSQLDLIEKLFINKHGAARRLG